jgi:hypothetical protein
MSPAWCVTGGHPSLRIEVEYLLRNRLERSLYEIAAEEFDDVLAVMDGATPAVTLISTLSKNDLRRVFDLLPAHLGIELPEPQPG